MLQSHNEPQSQRFFLHTKFVKSATQRKQVGSDLFPNCAKLRSSCSAFLSGMSSFCKSHFSFVHQSGLKYMLYVVQIKEHGSYCTQNFNCLQEFLNFFATKYSLSNPFGEDVPLKCILMKSEFTILSDRRQYIFLILGDLLLGFHKRQTDGLRAQNMRDNESPSLML